MKNAFCPAKLHKCCCQSELDWLADPGPLWFIFGVFHETHLEDFSPEVAKVLHGSLFQAFREQFARNWEALTKAKKSKTQNWTADKQHGCSAAGASTWFKLNILFVFLL